MTQPSLGQLLADLHAERVRTWEPAALKGNIDQRAHLVATADRASFVQAGDSVAGFNLEEVDGATLTLDSLLADSPAVLVFFRFATCPACNIALPYYQRQLVPALKALGASLTAVSPQVPERLVEVKRRHGFDFNVATDRDNALGRRFGILFESDAASQAAAKLRGNFIGDTTGTGTGELPMPAVVVIDRDHTVRFADVSPDWLVRTEAEPVIEVVRTLSTVAAE
jgi:peroxiredoxin